jgi:hypothetical protein
MGECGELNGACCIDSTDKKQSYCGERGASCNTMGAVNANGTGWSWNEGFTKQADSLDPVNSPNKCMPCGQEGLPGCVDRNDPGLTGRSCEDGFAFYPMTGKCVEGDSGKPSNPCRVLTDHGPGSCDEGGTGACIDYMCVGADAGTCKQTCTPTQSGNTCLVDMGVYEDNCNYGYHPYTNCPEASWQGGDPFLHYWGYCGLDSEVSCTCYKNPAT